MKQTTVFFFLLLTGCVIAQDFSTEDLSFMAWAKNGQKIKFVSDKNDSITVELSFDNREISSDYSSFKTRMYEFKMTRKDASYTGDFFEIRKTNWKTFQTIYYEGCIGDITVENFTNEFNSYKDVAIFEVMHHNYTDFKDKKRQLRKVWWSKNAGLLQYTTADATTWTRLVE